MKILLALAALCLVFVSPAHADSMTCQGQNYYTGSGAGYKGGSVCTKTFYFSGVCNGQDNTPTLVDNTGTINTPYIPGWEPVSISIQDVWIVFIPPRPATFYAFAGNNYTPDVMSWYTNEATERHLPAGTNMTFPAANTGSHLDLHVSCQPNNTPFQGFYTVVYQPNPM